MNNPLRDLIKLVTGRIPAVQAGSRPKSDVSDAEKELKLAERELAKAQRALAKEVTGAQRELAKNQAAEQRASKEQTSASNALINSSKQTAQVSKKLRQAVAGQTAAGQLVQQAQIDEAKTIRSEARAKANLRLVQTGGGTPAQIQAARYQLSKAKLTAKRAQVKVQKAVGGEQKAGAKVLDLKQKEADVINKNSKAFNNLVNSTNKLSQKQKDIVQAQQKLAQSQAKIPQTQLDAAQKSLRNLNQKEAKQQAQGLQQSTQLDALASLLKKLGFTGAARAAKEGESALKARGGDTKAMEAAMKEIFKELNVQLGKMVGILQGVTSAGRQFRVAVSSDSEIGGIGNIIGAGGTLGGLLPDPIGKAVKGILGFSDALLNVPDSLKKMGDAIHHSNIRFAEFSGHMAKVKALQDVRDIFLSRERGNRRAEKAEEFAQAKNRFDKALGNVEDKIWNSFTAPLKTMAAELGAKFFEALGGKPDEIDEGEDIDVAEWIKHCDSDKWYQSYGRPSRMEAGYARGKPSEWKP